MVTNPSLSRAALGGFVGTLAMTMLMYLVAPMMGLYRNPDVIHASSPVRTTGTMRSRLAAAIITAIVIAAPACGT